MAVTATHDAGEDAITVAFVAMPPAAIAMTEAIDDDRLLDYDAAGNVIAIELLHVSAGVHLDGLPRQEEVAAAVRSLAAFARA